MGIKGLWNELIPVRRKCHLREFRNQRLAVDAFGWLHRGALPSATKLATGEPCHMYLNFFVSRLELLKANGIEPVLVFDGRAVPMKQETNQGRQQRRRAARAEGMELLQQHETERAAKKFEQCIEVTPEMVLSAIRVAQLRKVRCIVAPFESDAQLSHLSKIGYVHGVLSEDCDMFCFGSRIVISKLDSAGNCEYIKLNDVHELMFRNTEISVDKKYTVEDFLLPLTTLINNNNNHFFRHQHQQDHFQDQHQQQLQQQSVIMDHNNNNNSHQHNDILLEQQILFQKQQQEFFVADRISKRKQAASNLRDDLFTMICVLSGCDYSASYPGIGMKKAIRIVHTALQTCVTKKQREAAMVLQNQQEQIVQQLRNSNGNRANINAALMMFNNSLPIPETLPKNIEVLHAALQDICDNYGNSSSSSEQQARTSSGSGGGSGGSAATFQGTFSDYVTRVNKAFYCFKHHLVWDYHNRKMEPINQLTINSFQQQLKKIIDENLGEDAREKLLNQYLSKEIVGVVWPREIGIKVCELFELRASTFKPYDFVEGSFFKKCLDLYWMNIRGANQPTIAHHFQNNNNKNRTNQQQNNEEEEDGSGMLSVAVFENGTSTTSTNNNNNTNNQPNNSGYFVGQRPFNHPRRIQPVVAPTTTANTTTTNVNDGFVQRARDDPKSKRYGGNNNNNNNKKLSKYKFGEQQQQQQNQNSTAPPPSSSSSSSFSNNNHANLEYNLPSNKKQTGKSSSSYDSFDDYEPYHPYSTTNTTNTSTTNTSANNSSSSLCEYVSEPPSVPPPSAPKQTKNNNNNNNTMMMMKMPGPPPQQQNNNSSSNSASSSSNNLNSINNSENYDDDLPEPEPYNAQQRQNGGGFSGGKGNSSSSKKKGIIIPEATVGFGDDDNIAVSDDEKKNNNSASKPTTTSFTSQRRDRDDETTNSIINSNNEDHQDDGIATLNSLKESNSTRANNNNNKKSTTTRKVGSSALDNLCSSTSHVMTKAPSSSTGGGGGMSFDMFVSGLKRK